MSQLAISFSWVCTCDHQLQERPDKFQQSLPYAELLCVLSLYKESVRMRFSMSTHNYNKNLLFYRSVHQDVLCLLYPLYSRSPCSPLCSSKLKSATEPRLRPTTRIASKYSACVLWAFAMINQPIKRVESPSAGCAWKSYSRLTEAQLEMATGADRREGMQQSNCPEGFASHKCIHSSIQHLFCVQRLGRPVAHTNLHQISNLSRMPYWSVFQTSNSSAVIHANSHQDTVCGPTLLLPNWFAPTLRL